MSPFTFFPKTRFSLISPWTSRLILLFVVVLVALGAIYERAPEFSSNQRGGDSPLFLSIIKRVNAGENYYQAAGEELRGRKLPNQAGFQLAASFPGLDYSSFAQLYLGQRHSFCPRFDGSDILDPLLGR